MVSSVAKIYREASTADVSSDAILHARAVPGTNNDGASQENRTSEKSAGVSANRPSDPGEVLDLIQPTEPATVPPGTDKPRPACQVNGEIKRLANSRC